MIEVDEELVSLAPIQYQLALLNNKFSNVYLKLEKEETKLDEVIENAEEFQEAVGQVQCYISETAAAIRQIPPIPLEADEIRKQLRDVEVCESFLVYGWIALFVCLFVCYPLPHCRFSKTLVKLLLASNYAFTGNSRSKTKIIK